MRNLRTYHPSDKHLWEITAVRDLLILIAAIFLAWMVYLLRDILLPVFVAFVLADISNPVITRMEHRWHWPRPLTVTLIIAAVFIAIIAFLAWLGPLLFNQFTSLADKLPEYLKTLGERYGIDLGDLLGQFGPSIQDIEDEPRKILGQIFSTTGQAVGVLAFIFGRATSILIAMILAVIFFFVFAWRFNDGVSKLVSYLPQNRRARIIAIVQRMDQAVGDFFRGRLVIAAIVGIALSIGWLLTGVPYWFFLGILTGILTIVPYLSLITWPAAIVLKYVDTLSGGSGADAGVLAILVWPSLVYFIVLFLEGWVLTPWIQGNQTHMSAATILLVVFIGGHFGGVAGLLFSIPIAACVKILFEEIFLPRLKRLSATDLVN